VPKRGGKREGRGEKEEKEKGKTANNVFVSSALFCFLEGERRRGRGGGGGEEKEEGGAPASAIDLLSTNGGRERKEKKERGDRGIPLTLISVSGGRKWEQEKKKGKKRRGASFPPKQRKEGEGQKKRPKGYP